MHNPPLRERLIDRLAQMPGPRGLVSGGAVKVVADDVIDWLLPVISEHTGAVPEIGCPSCGVTIRARMADTKPPVPDGHVPNRAIVPLRTLAAYLASLALPTMAGARRVITLDDIAARAQRAVEESDTVRARHADPTPTPTPTFRSNDG